MQTTQHSERSLTTLIIITARALVKDKPLIHTLLMPLRGLYHHLNVVQNDPDTLTMFPIDPPKVNITLSTLFFFPSNTT